MERVVDVPTPRRLSDAARVPSMSSVSPASKPEIGLSILHTISRFAEIDAQYENMVIALLAGEGPSVSILLRSITNHGQRLKVIRNVLEAHLRQEDKRLINKATDAIDEVRAIRNRFAHGLWLFSPSLPDALLLQETHQTGSLLGGAMQVMGVASSMEPAKEFISRIAGLGGTATTLSPEDQRAALNALSAMNQHPAIEAMMARLMSQGGPNGDDDTEVWSKQDAMAVAGAADAALNTAIGCLICIERSPEEAAPLRAAIERLKLLPESPHTYLSPH